MIEKIKEKWDEGLIPPISKAVALSGASNGICMKEVFMFR